MDEHHLQRGKNHPPCSSRDDLPFMNQALSYAISENYNIVSEHKIVALMQNMHLSNLSACNTRFVSKVNKGFFKNRWALKVQSHLRLAASRNVNSSITSRRHSAEDGVENAWAHFDRSMHYEFCEISASDTHWLEISGTFSSTIQGATEMSSAWSQVKNKAQNLHLGCIDYPYT